MSSLFPNHSYLSQILKHKDLPIYVTHEFNFYRCVGFNKKFYGKTVSELHHGNLRHNNHLGRYSKLFANEKISYWADSPDTGLKEIRKHGAGLNVVTFWAYDDMSSTFPTNIDRQPLYIIDGRELKFGEVLNKIEQGIDLDDMEQAIVKRIADEKPDCLAYNSFAKKGGVNFLFFEKGFKKLSLREVRLRIGTRKNDRLRYNKKTICCAGTSDYAPYIEQYGKYFLPIAKTGFDENYLNSDEYKNRKFEYKKSLQLIHKAMEENHE